MKYVRKFNEDIESVKSIEDWCKEFELEDYTINDNGTVDVGGGADLYWKKLKNIPIQFNIVTYGFGCAHNKLTSLKGCPKYVYGVFDCGDNKLETLEGGPKIVGSINYQNNIYNCRSNKLISLKGSPDEIIRGNLDCNYNPIAKIYNLFNRNYKKYQDSLDYNYLSGTNIIKLRFQEACEEADILIPS